MGERAYGDEIDALLGIVADGVEGDAARGLHLVAMVDELHGLARVGGREVVEHDAVDAAVVEHLLELVEVAHLDLDLQVEALLLEVGVATVDGLDDAA